jgi:hypothetical protein
MIDRSDHQDHRDGPVQQATQPRKGFTGLFAGLDLPNLLQMLAVNSITGCLRLRRETESGEIFLKGGEIVHATCGPLTGVEGFFRILSWEEGETRLEPDLLPPLESINLPWHALLIQTMAKLEDQKSQPPPEEAPPSPAPRAPQALETMQLHKLYTSAMSWGWVQSCLIGNLEKREIIRPSVLVPKLRQWVTIFAEMWERSKIPGVVEADSQPFMISVTLEKRNWILILHGSYLIALEVSRGVDMAEIHRKVRRVLSEGS